ncbi:MAG: hypothetical protein HC902_00800 [Calothrix sp. SM1_5_4]|nr:hypothetical protein [Calothrix sp. SM1_5_4]
MWQIVYLAIMITSISNADQRAEAVKFVERAQEALKELDQPNCDTCDVAMAGKEDPSWRRCLNAVCPIGFGQYYDGIKKSATIALNGPEEQKLIEQVKKSFRAEIEGDLAAYQRMLAFIKSGRTLNDPQAIQLGNLGLIIARIDKLVFNGKKLDEAASREQLKELSDAEFRTSLDVVNMMLGENYISSIALLDEDYDFYVQRHSAATIQTHINEALDSLTKASSQIETMWGIPQNAMFDTIRLGAVAKLKNGKFGRKELEDLRIDLASANFFRQCR